ncbi:hypothetical protein MHU86_22838 [Fragilaria crotonensis]|nr:hypothetical protein MHU86_22838 [Fragilaria crotonensis]
MFLLRVLVLLLLSTASWSFQILCRSRSYVNKIGYLQGKGPSNDEMLALEREVIESTKAKLDLKRINDAFLEEDDMIGPNDAWKVALAAALVASVASNTLLFHSLVLSSTVGMVVFFVANGDPLEEDSVAGSLARVVGRFTLKSVQSSQPKVRAVARAVVRGDEDMAQLQRRVEELEAENYELMLWKLRRQAVDEKLADFNVDELKAKARSNKIPIGGTKSQLLMRLVEAGIVNL